MTSYPLKSCVLNSLWNVWIKSALKTAFRQVKAHAAAKHNARKKLPKPGASSSSPFQDATTELLINLQQN